MSPRKKQKPGKGWMGKGWRVFIRFLIVLGVLTNLQVLLLRYCNPPFTARTAWTWFHQRFLSTGDDDPLYQWRPLRHISPHLRKAVLAAEDQRFLSHHGFDFVEMNKALLDILDEKGVRGASTISMQVARTLFLWPGRSWLRKLPEAYYTLLIEIFWSKKRILEVYLNTVDWGTGILGAEAASRRYFRRPCSEMTASEAALLAAVLPNPHRWSPIRPDRWVQERKRRILRDMTKMPLL